MDIPSNTFTAGIKLAAYFPWNLGQTYRLYLAFTKQQCVFIPFHLYHLLFLEMEHANRHSIIPIRSVNGDEEEIRLLTRTKRAVLYFLDTFNHVQSSLCDPLRTEHSPRQLKKNRIQAHPHKDSTAISFFDFQFQELLARMARRIERDSKSLFTYLKFLSPFMIQKTNDINLDRATIEDLNKVLEAWDQIIFNYHDLKREIRYSFQAYSPHNNGLKSVKQPLCNTSRVILASLSQWDELVDHLRSKRYRSLNSFKSRITEERANGVNGISRTRNRLENLLSSEWLYLGDDHLSDLFAHRWLSGELLYFDTKSKLKKKTSHNLCFDFSNLELGLKVAGSSFPNYLLVLFICKCMVDISKKYHLFNSFYYRKTHNSKSIDDLIPLYLPELILESHQAEEDLSRLNCLFLQLNRTMENNTKALRVWIDQDKVKIGKREFIIDQEMLSFLKTKALDPKQFPRMTVFQSLIDTFFLEINRQMKA